MGIPAELPEIPQRELRNEASRILREVRAGRSYTVTVDGAAVADLVPHRPARRRTAVPRDEAIAAFAGLSGSDDRFLSMTRCTTPMTAPTAVGNSRPEAIHDWRPRARLG